MNDQNINIHEEELYDKLIEEIPKIQDAAIMKFNKMTINKFYKHVVSDKSFIGMYNDILHHYDIYIEYYPRTKDKQGNWIIDTVFLPVKPVEVK